MTPFYQQAFAFLYEKGRLTYGKKFNLDEKDTLVIGRLIAWYIRDEPTATRHGMDLDKGILLSGPVGSGKTSLLSLMKFFNRTDQPLILKPCRDIAFEFQKDGFEVIRRYAAPSWHPSTAVPKIKSYCFDDLGTEQSLKHFGQECNIMAEIILSRYDHYIRHRMFTHFTTNLSADEIESIYGSRVRSRLREMCNLIAFPGDTPDKRK
ncbi:P-loop NTPase family protein [Alkaliflexus imshenetskii]|uniref:ATPase n=1 Tax=Alkaliflexus imshenetskii TaxID=286730 RepID=UPI00047CDA7A|nr:ATPase [Alkaliflexus imshenetskii]